MLYHACICLLKVTGTFQAVLKCKTESFLTQGKMLFHLMVACV